MISFFHFLQFVTINFFLMYKSLYRCKQYSLCTHVSVQYSISVSIRLVLLCSQFRWKLDFLNANWIELKSGRVILYKSSTSWICWTMGNA